MLFVAQFSQRGEIGTVMMLTTLADIFGLLNLSRIFFALHRTLDFITLCIASQVPKKCRAGVDCHTFADF